MEQKDIERMFDLQAEAMQSAITSALSEKQSEEASFQKEALALLAEIKNQRENEQSVISELKTYIAQLPRGFPRLSVSLSADDIGGRELSNASAATERGDTLLEVGVVPRPKSRSGKVSDLQGTFDKIAQGLKEKDGNRCLRAFRQGEFH